MARIVVDLKYAISKPPFQRLVEGHILEIYCNEFIRNFTIPSQFNIPFYNSNDSHVFPEKKRFPRWRKLHRMIGIAFAPVILFIMLP